MEIEVVAIILAVLSTVVTVIDLYWSNFRRGRVVVPPLRVLRLEPLNFHADGESYRSVRLTTALTFVNTGALSKVVDNLRIRVVMPNGQPVILDWRNECDSIEGDTTASRLATQPTLGPYESISKIYSFQTPSKAPVGLRVSELETYGEENPDQRVEAVVEMLSDRDWKPLRSFWMTYRGANFIEIDFDRLNAIG